MERGTIDVEPLKTDVVVGGDGPYKWIQSTFEKVEQNIHLSLK